MRIHDIYNQLISNVFIDDVFSSRTFMMLRTLSAAKRKLIPAAFAAAFLLLPTMYGSAGSVPSRTLVSVPEAANPISTKPRFEVFSETVKDTLTGLEWPRTMLSEAGPRSWEKAREYVKGLNFHRFLGHADWRVPSLDELLSLAECVRSIGFDGRTAELTVPAGLEAIGFREVLSTGYWTSSENRYNQGLAWAVDLGIGRAIAREKLLELRVMAVRSFR